MSEISDLNQSKPSLDDLEKIPFVKQVKVACEYILLIKKNTGSSNPLTSEKLFNEAKKEFPDIFTGDITATFVQYINNACRDTESKIIKMPGRGKGYYLDNSTEEIIDNSTEDTQEIDQTTAFGKPERQQREKLLYPFLESWLITQGYQAADVSSGRGMGRWGNPDVAGVSAIDTFNGSSIELITIEAKTSLDNWEQLIFEAISHRRFANRSYFAFTHAETNVNKIPPEMRYYAELYNIGVLVLSMPDAKYKELHSKENLIPKLSFDDVEIIEIFSAPYNFVQPKYQFQFCEAQGISCLKKLYQWGRSDK